MNKTIEQRRFKRRKQTSEFFTPPKLIAQIINKLPDSAWEEGKTFIDPACGNGNMLIQALWRKLEHGHDPSEALETIYGVDIMKDNIDECRLRLLHAVGMYETVDETHIRTVLDNIVHLSLVKYPKGSLDYDFSFKSRSYSSETLSRWLALSAS